MASIVNYTHTNPGAGAVSKLVINFTSDTDGTVSGTVPSFNGVILRVAFDPGSTAPTDNWDMTLTDENGLDVLGGQGADHDTASSEQICPGVPLKDGTTTSVVPVAVFGPLALSINGAGSGKTGSVTILYR